MSFGVMVPKQKTQGLRKSQTGKKGKYDEDDLDEGCVNADYGR